MIDLLRKNKRILLIEGFPDEAKIKEQPAIGIRKTLDVALSRLSATSRSLVLLKDYEGYSYQEIGAITGLSESQVKVYLHRARIELKNYLIKVEHVL
jgi:RNA polymerase sigma-70 factor (ECF subfamily)